MPTFVNLQQYHIEAMMVGAALADPLIDLGFRNQVTGLSQAGAAVTLNITTPDGAYRLQAGHVIACDGTKSPVRAMLGLEFEGELFEERFLIADIEMQADFPAERRFWFEPRFHPGQSALLHKQPDNIYRIDLQLGPDADAETERRPENLRPRIAGGGGARGFPPRLGLGLYVPVPPAGAWRARADGPKPAQPRARPHRYNAPPLPRHGPAGALPHPPRSGGGRALAARRCRHHCRRAGRTLETPAMTEALITRPNIADPDGVFAALTVAHRGLSDPDSHQMDAELVLILANHIGSRAVLDQALALARSGKGATDKEN